MARSQLRVYYGPQSDVCAKIMPNKEAKETVSVPLGEILPLLADAVRNERTWLAISKTTRSRFRPTCTK